MAFENFVRLLEETTLSRVFRHLQNEKIPVLIMSAYRAGQTEKQNKADTLRLTQQIRANKYGFFYLDGYWTYKEQGDEFTDHEVSVFVVGNEGDNGKLLGLARKWVKEFDQEAVLFKPEGTTTAELIYQNGKVEKLGKLSMKDVAKNFSQLRGRGNRKFVFESIGELRGHIAMMGESED